MWSPNIILRPTLGNRMILCLTLIAMLKTGVTGQNKVNELALQYIKKSSNDLEFSSILHSQEFRCMSGCLTDTKKVKDDLNVKPQMRQPVFVLKKNIVNCFNQAREVASFYKRKVSGLQMTQIRDLPLFYVSLFFQTNAFTAQKFCHLHGLEFGMDNNIGLVFNKDTENLKIWSSAVQADGKSNRSVACKFFQKKQNKVVETITDCFCQANFVCKLPETAHSTYCNSKCDGILTCPAKTSTDSCVPDCKQAECGDEPEDKFTYRAINDGDLVDICGRRYLFTKHATLGFQTADSFCCTKYMDLLSLETNKEMNCLAIEMTKMNLQNISFWTSGSSSSCPGNYAWCSVSEFLNKEEIRWSAPRSIDNSCISMQIVNGKNLIDNEQCSLNKRAICEVQSQNNCRDSMCYRPKCTAEYKQALKMQKTLYALGGVVRYSGCGTEISSSYHQAAKWCCSGNFSLISFETQTKLACFQDFYSAKNITATKYWVSGSSIGCNSKPKWCNNKLEPLIGDYVQWAPGEPSKDSSLECVYMEIHPKTRQYSFGIEKCRSLLSFLCEKNDF